MRTFPFQNANSSVITVTTTATALSSLIDTAGAVTHVFSPALDAVDIMVEDGDVRILYDSNTPTASKGILLKRGGMYRFRATPFSQMKLISATGGSVSCSVQIGHSDDGETSSAHSSGAFGEQLAGENLALDRLMTLPAYSNGRVTADGLVKSGSGYLHTIVVSRTDAAPVAGVLTIYDNTSEAGTVIWSGHIDTAAISPIVVVLDVAFTTGLYVGFDGTLADVSVNLTYL